MLRQRAGHLAVFVGYAAVSLAYFGRALAEHPGSEWLGSRVDGEAFIWSFAWWPHAIGHLINPFSTNVVYAPTGVNLAWATTSPALSLAFSPLTIAFGPVVAFNVAALLLPALAAWTAYLLCRHLTGSLWASLVAGYLFGFSSALIQDALWGDPNVGGVFLLPLIVLVVVRYLQAELSRRALAWRLGVLLALQLLISTEVALTASLVGGLALSLAFWLVPGTRTRLRAALIPIAAGYGVGGLLAAPFVVYALLGVPSMSLPGALVSSDLLNIVVPWWAIGLGGSTFGTFSERFPEGSVYLGVPVVLIVGTFAWRARGRPVARFLVALLLTCLLLALGSTLHVDGRKSIPLPWRAVSHLPVFGNVLPFRFTVYLSLAAAVIVALWTAESRGRFYARPLFLPVLAVAALVPAVWTSSFRETAFSHPESPAFFTDGLYKTCIPPNETMAMFPFGSASDSLLWQAETGFPFRLAVDGLGTGTAAWTTFDSDWVVKHLSNTDVSRPNMDSLLAFAAIHHVDRILSVVGDGYPTAVQMRTFGPTERIGGMLVSPACGQPSLATRDLSAVVQTYLAQRQSQAKIDYCLGTTIESLEQGLEPAGVFRGAKPALYVAGQGLTCVAPTGYIRHGFAPAALEVAPNIYPYYRP
jgi:hypothetical protein